MRFTIIGGHGKQPNGTFNHNATGNGFTEATYVRERIMSTMKKYVPEKVDMRFVVDHDVYAFSTLTNYKNDVVVEIHLDGSVPEASGGHVIIHEDYAPDGIDLGIRDVIKKYIGVRYNHKGYQGFSGRSDLKNCNIARQNNINYRLVECAFVTNKRDMENLEKHLEAFCRDLVLAICGSVRKPLQNGNQKPQRKGIVIEKMGGFIFNDDVLVRDRPSTKGKHIATYKKGKPLDKFDRIHFVDDYVWLEYTRSNGKGKGFVPVCPLNSFWGKMM